MQFKLLGQGCVFDAKCSVGQGCVPLMPSAIRTRLCPFDAKCSVGQGCVLDAKCSVGQGCVPLMPSAV